MWLLIITTCLYTQHECIIQKTVHHSEWDCAVAAQHAQARFDAEKDRKFVLVCREVKE